MTPLLQVAGNHCKHEHPALTFLHTSGPNSVGQWSSPRPACTALTEKSQMNISCNLLPFFHWEKYSPFCVLLSLIDMFSREAKPVCMIYA